MSNPVTRATLFALYQLSIAAGIAFLPLAVLANRGGVHIPLHRMIERFGRAYENRR